MVVVSILLHAEFGRKDHREKISNRNLNTKRCYNDSWLYISIPAVVLSLSIQASTIGNDDHTIFSSSFWFDIGTSSYNETFQRFLKIFKCNKNEDSVKARDQRISINVVFWPVINWQRSEDLLLKFLLYSHIYLSSIACLTKSDGKVRLAILYQAKMYKKTLASELKARNAKKWVR